MATMIVGEPCVGKSTVMRCLMAQYKAYGWKQAAKPFFHHFSERGRITVLGRYDDEKHQFPGTDRLSMSVQPVARDWVIRDPLNHHIVFEGDRLGNLKFATSLMEAGFDFCLLVVDTDRSVLEARRKAERSQPEAFVKGRATKVANLADALPPSLVARAKNDNSGDPGRIAEWVWRYRRG